MAFVLCPFTERDRCSVTELLTLLPHLYPNGYFWLTRRLDDALSGRARCTLAKSRYGIVGVTIETPKGRNRTKLSTIYVRPSFRGLGVGTRLLEACLDRWVRSEVRSAYVTVEEGRSILLRPLLTGFGFRFQALERNRYGTDRNEVVFDWEPSIDGAIGCNVHPARTSRCDLLRAKDF